jgi:hypothetical protein
MKQRTAAGGDRLTRAGAEPEKDAELVIASTESKRPALDV